MNEFNNKLQEQGFYSEEELLKWVYRANIESPEKLALFKAWQEHDGTKDKLVSLIRTDCL